MASRLGASRSAHRDSADGGAHRGGRQRRSRGVRQRQRHRERRQGSERRGGGRDGAAAASARHRRFGDDRFHRHDGSRASKRGGGGVSQSRAQRSRAGHFPPDLSPRSHGGGARTSTREPRWAARSRGQQGHADRAGTTGGGRAQARAGVPAAAVGHPRPRSGARTRRRGIRRRGDRRR